MSVLRKCLMLTVLSGAAVLFALPSRADDPKTPAGGADPAKKDSADNIELLTQAYRLADYAKEYNSPEAYIAAGSLLLRFNAKTGGKLGELNAEPEVQDENGKPVPGAKAEAAKTPSLAQLAEEQFEAASNLGVELKESKEVEAMIKVAKARTYPGRGAHGGPRTRAQLLNPNGTHRFSIGFDAHSMAAIGFRATMPVRIQMSVAGHNHFNQVISVGQYSWVPGGSGVRHAVFTIHNPNHARVNYQLFTN